MTMLWVAQNYLVLIPWHDLHFDCSVPLFMKRDTKLYQATQNHINISPYSLCKACRLPMSHKALSVTHKNITKYGTMGNPQCTVTRALQTRLDNICALYFSNNERIKPLKFKEITKQRQRYTKRLHGNPPAIHLV